MELISTQNSQKEILTLIETALRNRLSQFSIKSEYSVNNPPGHIENRVFIGGSYILMPILREIEQVVVESGYQPILARDFSIPREKTREYILRLLFQCKYAIFEETYGGGQVAEIVRASGFEHIKFLQVYMTMDEKREPPNTLSAMIWQTNPPPQGYITIKELREIVQAFLASSAINDNK
jgi:signal recognition particle subunit SEC65